MFVINFSIIITRDTLRRSEQLSNERSYGTTMVTGKEQGQWGQQLNGTRKDKWRLC